jgi:hypothetical protein
MPSEQEQVGLFFSLPQSQHFLRHLVWLGILGMKLSQSGVCKCSSFEMLDMSTFPLSS